MKNTHLLTNLVRQYQYGIDSLPFVIDYIKDNFSFLEIKSVSPYSFTIGSDNHGENIQMDIELKNSLFFGDLQICINPNSNPLADELIELKYRSYWNTRPYWKFITRKVEIENLINESTYSRELFDSIELTQLSNSYDVYVTFTGFKIDVI